MASVPVFRSARGLNNRVEPNRLKYAEDGSCELAEAVNVIIDDSGSVKRRYGITPVFVTGPCHSLWSWGPFCLFVSEGNLYRRMSVGSNVLVYSGCGDAPMHYAEFAGRVYCSNGSFRAKLYGMSIESWDAVVPAQYRSDTRTLGIPDSFTLLCAHAGRMYAADGQFLWESEPALPGCYDLGGGAMSFESEITALVSVRGGIYVSTAFQTYFLNGSSSKDFVRVEAHPSPIVPGTAQIIAGDELGNGDMAQGQAAIWVSRDGVCVGDASGNVTNVTSRRLVFDQASSGAACVLPGQYFFSLEVA